MSNGIHSCGYHCERPACIKAQRSHLYAQNERLREAARMALEALRRWDGLIEHQYTGSSAAMTDMHLAAQATVPVLEALREALGDAA